MSMLDLKDEIAQKMLGGAPLSEVEPIIRAAELPGPQKAALWFYARGLERHFMEGIEIVADDNPEAVVARRYILRYLP